MLDWTSAPGGVAFGRGALSYFLRNRFFIGEVKYRGEILSEEQPAILDRALFGAVQQKLSAHQSHRTLTRQKADHLLRDLLFDDAGHRMIATHATFLAPQLVKAAVEGRLPRGINIERLRDPDPNWATQFQDLGLTPIS